MGACKDFANDNFIVNSSIVLCGGVKNIIDSDNNGVIRFNSHNMVLDCNNTLIIGNNGSNTYGIQGYFSGFRNVTIKRCKVSSYANGIGLNHNDKSNITNNTLFSNKIGLRILNVVGNSTISYNNILGNNDGTSSTRGIDATIKTSNFTRNYLNNNYYGFYFGSTTQINKNIIINNWVYNSTYTGMFFDGGTNITILNNYIKIPDYSINTNGILRQFGNYDKNFTVKYNVVSGSTHGIKLDYCKFCTIEYNNISNIGIGWGLATYRNNNSFIRYNKVTNCSWNCIYHDGENTTISYNIIKNYYHHGIDTHNDNNVTITKKSLIFKNNITSDNIAPWTTGDAGIFFQVGIYSKIYNNYIYNNKILAGVTSTKAIAVEGGNYSFGNRVYNNTIYNVSGACIYDSAKNTTWFNNSFTLCNKVTYFSGYTPQGKGRNNGIIKNNKWIDNSMNIITNSVFNYMNLKINESVNVLTYNLSTSNGKIILNYNGIKNITIGINNISIIGSLNTVKYNISSGESWRIGERTNCWLPYENFGLATGVKNICNGNYYGYDQAKNGYLIFNQSNTKLNCRNATFNSNYSINSIAIQNQFSSYNNNTIINCKFNNWDRAIYFFNNNKNKIENNSFKNINYSIKITVSSGSTSGKGYSIIKNNTIINVSYYGINLEYSTGYNVSNNKIINRLKNSTGIYIFRTNKTIISYNYIKGMNGISLSLPQSINHQIINNIINGSQWNGIDCESNNTNCSFNVLYNTNHSGIDICDGTRNNHDYLSSIKIYNNTLYNSVIYACMGKNTNIYNNKIYNVLLNNAGQSFGISLSGNNSALSNNKIYNNYISNILGTCILLESTGHLIENNTFNLCKTNTYRTDSWYQNSKYNSTLIIKNNNYLNNYIYLYRQFGLANLTVTINESNLHLLNWSNYNKSNVEIIKDKIYFIYGTNRIKNLNLKGNSSICKLGSCIQNLNVVQYNINKINASQNIFIFGYSTSTQPRVNSVATGITYVDYYWNPSTYTLIWTQTGTGSTQIDKVLDYVGSHSTTPGLYSIKKDGTFIGTSTLQNYTISSSGTYVFYPWGYSLADNSPLSSTLMKTVVNVFLILIILSVLFIPLIKWEEYDVKEWLTLLVIDIVTIILYIWLVVMINNL